MPLTRNKLSSPCQEFQWKTCGCVVLRPPVNEVNPATLIEPAVSPGAKPKLVSAAAGLMAAPPAGAAARTRLKPNRRELTKLGPNRWFSSKVITCRLVLKNTILLLNSSFCEEGALSNM